MSIKSISLNQFIATLMLILALPSTASAVCIYENGPVKWGHIRILGGFIDPVDEAYFYSDTLGVDTSYLPEVTGLGDIGAWSYEFVTLDHNGNSLPGGAEGIRFFLTSGDGISEGEYANFKFSAINSNSAQWFSDYHDSAANSWVNGEQCVDCLPPVPVPATFWFFGSGLLTLLGIGRYPQKG